MVVYAVKCGVRKVYLIYPLHRNEEPETMEVRYDIHLNESDIDICIQLEILKVPFAYAESEEKTKELMKRIFRKVSGEEGI